MEWVQLFTLFLANASLIVWFRAESRSDWRLCDAKIDAIREDSKAFQKAMLDEIKDFHGRLCSIEERNKTYKNEG